MYCSNCGNKIEKEHKFCSKCGNKIESGSNSLYEQIKKYVISENKTSISMLEKKFNLKHDIAIDMINRLENDKIIGPAIGKKPREVLVNNSDEKKNDTVEERVKDAVDNFMNTPDMTSEYEKKDIKDNMFLALLSYIGVLALIPYFASNNSKFVKYHSLQGMNLLVFWGIYTIVDNLVSMIKVSEIVVNYNGMRGSRLVTPIWLSFPLGLVGFVLGVLSIIGIIYVCEGKAKELPLIGKIKIIK